MFGWSIRWRSTLAEIEIRFVVNLNTGRHDVLIDFISDDDALPVEH